MPGTKVCTKCKEPKPYDKTAPQRTRGYGWDWGTCYDCCKKIRQARQRGFILGKVWK
jgi:hypothetical protein